MKVSRLDLARTVAEAARGSFPWLAISYAALFAAFGTEAPFFPAFMAAKGLQPGEIGVLLSAGTVVRLSVGPFLGAAADRSGPRRMLAIAAPCAAMLGLGYLVGASFAAFLIVALVHSASLAALNPLLDTLALDAIRREASFRYGWVRGIGSAAFVLATLASGFVVGAFGLASVIVVSSVFFAFVAVPLAGIAEGVEQAIAPASPWAGFSALFAIPIFRCILLVAGLVIGSQAMSDTFAVIHWRAAGVSSAITGLLWAEAVASEMLVFLVIGPWLLARFGPARCTVGSALSGVLQWGALASTTAPALLCLSQPLHGFTFALTHLACMQVIGEAIPPERLATAQTLYGTLSLGVASAVLTFLSGEVWGTLGAHAFWIMSGMCLLAVPLASRLATPSRPARTDVASTNAR